MIPRQIIVWARPSKLFVKLKAEPFFLEGVHNRPERVNNLMSLDVVERTLSCLIVMFVHIIAISGLVSLCG